MAVPPSASKERLYSSPLLPDAFQLRHLRELLRSNAAPSDLESPHLRSAIASSPADIARYDENIGRLQASVDDFKSSISELVAGRDVLRAYSDGCSSIFSTVRRLPVEVLTAIFPLCAPEAPHFYEFGSRHLPVHVLRSHAAQLHLLRISQVSASWYAIVMSTPSLWTTIYLDALYAPGPGTGNKIMELLAVSLERSANLPLTVYVRAGDPHGGPALRLLAQHSRRWLTADFYLRHAAFEPLSAAKGNIPLLEHLEIGGSGLDRLDIFETAPKLTEAVFSKFGASPRLPWDQLLEVTYNNRYFPKSIGDGFAVMVHCSNRCQFTIEGLDISRLTLPLSGLKPVQSDILNFALSLAGVEDRDHSAQVLNEILATLSFPCMRSLRLRSSDHGFPLHWPRIQFSNFVLRSGCRDTLADLRIQNTLISADDLVACLAQMSALTTLLLADVPVADPSGGAHIVVTDTLLHELRWSPHLGCLVPRLNRIELQSFLEFSDEEMLRFIDSRLIPGRTNDGPFEMRVAQYKDPEAETQREIHGTVIGRISEIVSQDDLRWSFRHIANGT
ncbi:hypothetical protein B0H11DRAFT_1285372 [Mycena galericulata]|nr:hypothetical protein B0H11DRAFT_1285372 [Mycena galericulata]